MKNAKTRIWLMVVIVSLVYAIGVQASLTDGLAAYYPFNGNANDESGNGNNGTVNGATLTQDRFGNPDSAYSFDGLNDYIMISSSPSLDIRGNLTIAAWVYNIDTAGEIMWRGDNESGSDPYTLNLEAGKMNLWVFDGSGSTYSAAYSKEQVGAAWRFWVGIYDTDLDKISLYKDGGLENIEDIGPEITYETSTMWNVIGALGDIGGNPFGGVIDEVRVYNRVLNETEITELYQIPEPITLLLLGLGAVMVRSKQ